MTKPPISVSFQLNGREVHSWVAPNSTLLYALRTTFGATDVKYGCGEGVCGTCTVLIDGEPSNACLVLAVQVAGCEVMTLSGMVDSDGGLHELQESFLKHGGAQCGFCTPGMILTAYDYAERGGSVNREDIRGALSGNLCRCTGYVKIVDAIEAYVAEQSGRSKVPA